MGSIKDGNNLWEQVFMNRRIPAVLQYERSLRQEIEEKQVELRQMVCLNYKSFLQAAEGLFYVSDKLKDITQNASDMFSKVNSEGMSTASKVWNEHVAPVPGKNITFNFLAHCFHAGRSLLLKHQLLPAVRLYRFLSQYLNGLNTNEESKRVLLVRLQALDELFHESFETELRARQPPAVLLCAWSLYNSIPEEDSFQYYLDKKTSLLRESDDLLQNCQAFLYTCHVCNKDVLEETERLRHSLNEKTIFKDEEILQALGPLPTESYRRIFDEEILSYIPTIPTERMSTTKLEQMLNNWKVSTPPLFLDAPQSTEKLSSLQQYLDLIRSLFQSIDLEYEGLFQELWNSQLRSSFQAKLETVINDMVSRATESLCKVCTDVLETYQHQSKAPFSIETVEWNLTSLRGHFASVLGFDDALTKIYQELFAFNNSLETTNCALQEIQSLKFSGITTISSPSASTNLFIGLCERYDSILNDAFELFFITLQNQYHSSLERVSKESIPSVSVRFLRLLRQLYKFSHIKSRLTVLKLDDLQEEACHKFCTYLQNTVTESFTDDLKKELADIPETRDEASDLIAINQTTSETLWKVMRSIHSFGVDILSPQMKRILAATLGFRMFVSLEETKTNELSESEFLKAQVEFDQVFICLLFQLATPYVQSKVQQTEVNGATTYSDEYFQKVGTLLSNVSPALMDSAKSYMQQVSNLYAMLRVYEK
ncbi:hypothetical protein SJAG_00041 [Schizosaccharomyces japonicus yFS275]|uniref:Uncharacterized protein n=1 Tax=Schizosaccharomyces japonicus (strain yFS275 / FY16936) TaxID=402676 RepID=B6JUU8_SCHJY|nr:hypothetical protein SJAG_00041 [Schizosaccharomyces japonicus yFS275]EEB05049.1 hypothetical protein SJAG_00041 [Schizosaccharomyces japonicus yFS275]